jgi:hypothetical protein
MKRNERNNFPVLIIHKNMTDLVDKQNTFKHCPKHLVSCLQLTDVQNNIFCSGTKSKLCSRSAAFEFFDDVLESHAFYIN